MKTKSFAVSGVGLWLVLSTPSFSQTSKLALGVDFGTSVIQIEPVFLPDFSSGPGESINSDFVIPKNIRGRIELGLGRDFILRFAAGYGFMQDVAKLTRSSQANGSNGSPRIYREAKFSVAGVPAEATMFWRVPLDDQGLLAIQFGLGGGFYSYKIKSKQFLEITGSSNPGDNGRLEFQAPEMKLSGPAQFFVAGFAIRLSSRASATFEISKLGFSMLKLRRQDDAEGFVEKQDYNSGAGLSDVALALGINLNLSK